MKVWVTKYALTTGIQEYEVEEVGSGMVRTPGNISSGGGQYFHGEGRDWHRQKWQAQAHAETMRKKKIESLKKSITKFEKMRF